MATTYPALQRPAAKSVLLRAIVAVILLVVIAAFAIRGYFLHVERAALPQLDGTITAGWLSAPVTVNRHQHGIPHIYAATDLDAVFAQGYVTAQDRLWQMDMIRRIAAGELAEILGEKYIDHDKKQRYLQIRHTAEVAVEYLDPQTRAILDDYSRGVNTWIAATRAHLPLEFRLLRYQPRDWTPVDSVLAGLNMAPMLNETYPDDLNRERIAAHVSSEI